MKAARKTTARKITDFYTPRTKVTFEVTPKLKRKIQKSAKLKNVTTAEHVREIVQDFFSDAI